MNIWIKKLDFKWRLIILFCTGSKKLGWILDSFIISDVPFYCRFFSFLRFHFSLNSYGTFFISDWGIRRTRVFVFSWIAEKPWSQTSDGSFRGIVFANGSWSGTGKKGRRNTIGLWDPWILPALWKTLSASQTFAARSAITSKWGLHSSKPIESKAWFQRGSLELAPRFRHMAEGRRNAWAEMCDDGGPSSRIRTCE